MHKRLRHLPALFLALGLPALACGCTDQYPLDREGTWQPTGVNDRNLLYMVANPADLTKGEAATSDRGNAGALAARRLFTDHRRPLLNAQTSSVGGQTQNTPDQPMAAATGLAASQ